MTNAETRHRHANSPSSRRQRHETPRYSCPEHRCFEDFTSRQLGLSQPTPPMSATLNRATNTNDAGSPKMSGAYHFDSRSSTHLQSPSINARQPTRSKPYNTNHCEEEGPTWPFASTPLRPFTTVEQCVQEQFTQKTDSLMRYTKLQKMFATTCVWFQRQSFSRSSCVAY